jgi:hypothetical protein
VILIDLRVSVLKDWLGGLSMLCLARHLSLPRIIVRSQQIIAENIRRGSAFIHKFDVIKLIYSVGSSQRVELGKVYGLAERLEDVPVGRHHLMPHVVKFLVDVFLNLEIFQGFDSPIPDQVFCPNVTLSRATALLARLLAKY